MGKMRWLIRDTLLQGHHNLHIRAIYPTPDFEELCVGAGELRSRNFDRYATTYTIVVKAVSVEQRTLTETSTNF
jgi:hypothetical protein